MNSVISYYCFLLYFFLSYYYLIIIYFFKGYGLVTHRAIRCICEMLGIKDLWAKAEGPTSNTLNLTKAFFIGLMKQVKIISLIFNIIFAFHVLLKKKKKKSMHLFLNIQLNPVNT